MPPCTPAYAERTGAWAPVRAEGPVTFREYVCPGCACRLDTEVTLGGAARMDDVRPEFYVAAAPPERA